MIIEINM